MWGQLLAILYRDLLSEWRAREVVIGMLVMALLTLLVFNFAFDLTGAQRAASGSGAFWVAVVFATLLGLGRMTARERQDGAWEGLVLAPVERSVIYVAKLLSMVLFVAIVELVALVVLAALFDLPVFRSGVLVVLALGTVGLCALGTLFSVMTAQAKAREVLLPALLFPLAIPVVIGGVRAMMLELSGAGAEAAPWKSLLGGIAVLFAALSVLTFGVVVEE
ncbi:MAG: heme exporter protein CcmB [Thermomicrobium sp.]|nr:heme exporter protein CcmB [Thermomicrobium sp.]MDW8006350.1 heme exporter protein CcmB [Thermomicrobium sp.]